MLIEQPPQILRMLYPSAMWRMDKNEKSVYLTFDDGPIPEITPWVLDLLDKYGIKATFFMVGDNVRKHPAEFRMVVERGHRIGNHTFNHIRGFEFLSKNYLANTDKANEYLHTDLFRPPHGHMRWLQYMVLKKNLNGGEDNFISLTDLHLEKDEKITEIKIYFGNVDVGFKSEKKPHIIMKTNENLENDTKIENSTVLEGYNQDYRVSSKDTAVSTIYNVVQEKKLPRTGF